MRGRSSLVKVSSLRVILQETLVGEVLDADVKIQDLKITIM